MALTINHQTNDISATSGSVTIDMAASETESAATMYIHMRQAAYPALEEQLDKIFHEGVDAWKVSIQAIKDANPKP